MLEDIELPPQLSYSKSSERLASQRSAASLDKVKQSDVTLEDLSTIHSRGSTTKAEPSVLDEKKRTWTTAVADRWARTQNTLRERRMNRKERHRQRREEKAADPPTEDAAHSKPDRQKKVPTAQEKSEVKEDTKDRAKSPDIKTHRDASRDAEAKIDAAKSLKEVIDKMGLPKKEKDPADKKSSRKVKDPSPERPQKSRKKRVTNPPHELSMTPLEAFEYRRGRERGEYFTGFSSTGEILVSNKPHTSRRCRTSSGRRSLWREPGVNICPVMEESFTAELQAPPEETGPNCEQAAPTHQDVKPRMEMGSNRHQSPKGHQAQKPRHYQ